MSERHATDTAIITYADFIDICHVDDINDFGGFRVETNGLWVNLPPRDVYLTARERSVLSWHPTGRYDEPALSLPCALVELRAFVNAAGLAGCIDEGAVGELLASRAQNDQPQPRVPAESQWQTGTPHSGVIEVGPDDDEQGDEPLANDAPKIDEWKVRAREIANEIWLRMLRLCKKPIKEEVAREIAGRLSRERVVTKNGKRIEAGYIVRFALGKGWTPPKPE